MTPHNHSHEHNWLEPYNPIDVLKPAATNVWIVDGPEIEFGFGWLKVPFTTRMTIVRLHCGDLVLHSPVRHTPALQAAVEELGPIRYLIAPNSLHYWWLPDWKARLPGATVLAVPGLQKRAKRPVLVDRELTGHDTPWPDEIDMLVVSGDALTEAVFFHRASRTLILTDLIENFEPKRIHGWFYRALMKIGGVVDPDGKAPFDMQLSFFRHEKPLRAAVRRMINWQPDRVIIAHGRWYETDGVKELKRAFRWVL